MRWRQRTSRSIVALTALAVIVGPQWCCCTFKTVAAVAEVEGPCCCCEAPAAVPGSSASCSPDSSEGHPAGGGGCPCRAKLRPVAASVGGTVSTGFLEPTLQARGLAPWPLSFWYPAIQPDVSSSPARWRSPADTPRLSGRALLRALSTLRC